MGFSIGGLLSGIGGLVGGVTKVAGAVGAVRGAFNGSKSGPGPKPAALRFPGSGLVKTVRSSQVGPGTAQAGVISRFVAPAILGALSVNELLQLARENTGQPVNAKRIAESIRVCGIETTAAAFGLSETQVCLIALGRRRRRARGISAADLRRTRATIRKVHHINHDLQALRPTVRRHHR